MDYSFNKDIACKIGVDKATMLQNMHFWIMKNMANKKNYFDGNYWTYNSIKAFSILFPFWSEKQIRRILTQLEEEGYIVSGNYNKIPYDRTKWYALTKKTFGLYGEAICPNGQMNFSKWANESAQKGEPIPYINTDSKPDNKNILSCKQDDIKLIINYLNEITNQHYRTTTKATTRLIGARLKEGFTVSDFKTVIEKKANEWMKDPSMCMYLRPETLFGTKFEAYLNQPVAERRLSKEEQRDKEDEERREMLREYDRRNNGQDIADFTRLLSK